MSIYFDKPLFPDQVPIRLPQNSLYRMIDMPAQLPTIRRHAVILTTRMVPGNPGTSLHTIPSHSQTYYKAPIHWVIYSQQVLFCNDFSQYLGRAIPR